jgi:hypothetical protein
VFELLGRAAVAAAFHMQPCLIFFGAASFSMGSLGLPCGFEREASAARGISLLKGTPLNQRLISTITLADPAYKLSAVRTLTQNRKASISLASAIYFSHNIILIQPL